eukprot:13068383-Alexandrium_andersonii.AAC.1
MSTADRLATSSSQGTLRGYLGLTCELPSRTFQLHWLQQLRPIHCPTTTKTSALLRAALRRTSPRCVGLVGVAVGWQW